MEITLPTNLEYERLVLGSIMAFPELFHTARPLLNVADFSLELNRRIWRRSCELYDAGQEVDRITVYSAMRENGETAGDTLSYLVELDTGLPQSPSFGCYIQGLKDVSVRRSVIFACQHLQNQCMERSDSPQTILDSAMQTIMGLTPQQSGTGLQSAAEVVDEIGLAALLQPRRETGLPFPWPWMNYRTGGMLPAELWVLAGHTSTGKTSAMLQHAVTAARRGHSVAIFSLEVGKQSLFQKAVYQMARVDSERGKRGKLDLQERELVNQAAAELYELPLYFDTQSTTTMAIHAAVRRQNLKGRVDHVIVDYLQLLGNSGKHDNRAQAVGANAWALKILATEFQVPVLLLSQFSRSSAKPGQSREPELTDLKESGDIENHANGVWFLHRPDNTDANQIPVKFMLPKQRDGRRNVYQDFFFYPQYQRFEQVTNEEYE